MSKSVAVKPTPPSLAEPVIVSEFWANRRGESIRVQLRVFEGRTLVDMRKYFTDSAGKLQATKKGLALVIARLPEFARAITKALERPANSAWSRAAMSERRRLADRRACETFTLEAGGLSYIATTSRFDDGRLGEIFLTTHKAGSAADTAARDAAITCSLALQFGADIDTIRKALCRDGQGRASGPLGVALDLLAVSP
jgi:ribonucleoside-diphosphate reductase alpha chain